MVRLEQVYPLDFEKINSIFDKYKNRKDFIWAQEEPENMGVWSFILRNFRDTNIQLISPDASGTPAPGSHKMFEKNQTKIINSVFQCNDEPAKKPVTA